MAEPVDVVVPRAVLLDVEVGLRDVRLGLVVVVVGDEVLDGVVREELAELVAELRRERLVVGDHERRATDLLDDPRHRRRLAGAGRAEQRLVALARCEPGRERRRSRAAGRPVGAYRRQVFSSAMRDQRSPRLAGRAAHEVERTAAPHRRTAVLGEPGPQPPGRSGVAQSPQSKSREPRPEALVRDFLGDRLLRLLGRCFRLLGCIDERVLGRRPIERRRLVDDRLSAVHRVLDPRLLLGLEQRMILERVVRHVLLERHFVLESSVAPLQLEVLLDDRAQSSDTVSTVMPSSCSDVIPRACSVEDRRLSTPGSTRDRRVPARRLPRPGESRMARPNRRIRFAARSARSCFCWELWRRLPRRQRQQILLAARRHGPRLAGGVYRFGRSRG